MAEKVVDKKQINRDIFKMVLPIIIENLLQMTAGIITTAMIGRLVADDISAQGIGNRIINTFWALFKGIGTGATVIIALRYGEKKLGLCRRTAEQTYLTVIPVTFLCVALVLWKTDAILSFFTDSQPLLLAAAQFTKIAIFAVPFMALSAINAAAYNGHGNTKTPMYIAILMNIVNVVVGATLIFGFGPFPALGLVGAAIGTALSWAIGGITGTLLLYIRGGYCATEKHGLKFFSLDKPSLSEVYKTGAPAACENVFWQMSAILLSKIILLYGSAYFAAYQIGLQIEMLFEMPGIGFVTASTSLAAMAIGQRNSALYKAYFTQMRKFALYVGIFASVALFIGANASMRLLTDKPEIQALGAVYVFIMGFAQIPQQLAKVYNGTIRAAGYRNTPMFISFVGIWLVRVPISVLCGWVLHWDIKYIWIAIAVDQIVRILISFVIFEKKRVLHVIDDGKFGKLR